VRSRTAASWCSAISTPATSSAKWACSFRSTTAKCCCARTACELAELSYERLHQLFAGPLAAECPRILYAIGAQLSKRLLDTSRKASRLAFLDVSGRIIRTLNDLCQEPDAMSHPQGTQIRVSRQEISRIVGCSREMAGRVLKQLQQEGKLHARGKTVVVFGTR
jgi:CRP/FNR family cyclic AMP-dependent transcriptional regulator